MEHKDGSMVDGRGLARNAHYPSTAACLGRFFFFFFFQKKKKTFPSGFTGCGSVLSPVWLAWV
jgi:hypothetical protein